MTEITYAKAPTKERIYMDLKIKINGEFTKEELQEKIKEFDKPEWKIKLGYFDDILLYSKNQKLIVAQLLSGIGVSEDYNLSTVSRAMAEVMDDLVGTKDVLNNTVLGYGIHYDSALNVWKKVYATFNTNEKHFKTRETANVAVELLNNSKDIKDWIKRMSE